MIYTRYMAERVGFEPTCRLPDKTLSRRPRYDHFGTSPGRAQADLPGTVRFYVLFAPQATREHVIISGGASCALDAVVQRKSTVSMAHRSSRCWRRNVHCRRSERTLLFPTFGTYCAVPSHEATACGGVA